jgi:hypothetical protein
MGTRRSTRELTVRRAISQSPMTPEALEGAERLLARLIARAYLADNPQLLSPQRRPHDPEAGGQDDGQGQSQDES